MLIRFKVAEVNDLTTDGANSKRVVLTADLGNYDSTGPKRNADQPDLPKGGFYTGRVELVVTNAVQADNFPLGSLHVISLSAEEKQASEAKSDDTDAPVRRR